MGQNVLKQEGYEALKQLSKENGGHHILKTGNTDNGKISIFINGDSNETSAEQGDTSLLDPETKYYYIKK